MQTYRIVRLIIGLVLFLVGFSGMFIAHDFLLSLVSGVVALAGFSELMQEFQHKFGRLPDRSSQRAFDEYNHKVDEYNRGVDVYNQKIEESE